jgi:2-oxoglutarate dehydrogenase E2 component (dihydrolipoamide succinyltransferase)
MANELIVPPLGESVSEATVARWLKKTGESVKIDDPVVELETDKVTLEVNAPASGVLERIIAPEGTLVSVGKVLGIIGTDAALQNTVSSQPQFQHQSQQHFQPHPQQQPQQAQYQPQSHPSASGGTFVPAQQERISSSLISPQESPVASPAARKILEETSIHLQAVQGTGPGGRITKSDVYQFAANHLSASAPSQATPPSQLSQSSGLAELSEPSGVSGALGVSGASDVSGASGTTPGVSVPSVEPAVSQGSSQTMTYGNRMTPLASRQIQVAQPEERVRMSRLRQRIAERLKEAQNTAAMLTTFNEIDMSHVMATRDSYREKFEKRFGIKLGFMSFFVKAAVSALKEIPAVNAEIDGDEIVYKNYYDIGVAVSAPQGLVVPVVRDADHLNFAEIEMMIGQLSEKARTGKLSMEDLNGGTFTITNGGVFGSLMSTPILNPPQSGILGMHKIQQRPVVVGDRIESRPMMYVALTYDHRVIDGREAVTFLVRIKENIEDPQRILLGI